MASQSLLPVEKSEPSILKARSRQLLEQSVSQALLTPADSLKSSRQTINDKGLSEKDLLKKYKSYFEAKGDLEQCLFMRQGLENGTIDIKSAIHAKKHTVTYWILLTILRLQRVANQEALCPETISQLIPGFCLATYAEYKDNQSIFNNIMTTMIGIGVSLTQRVPEEPHSPIILFPIVNNASPNVVKQAFSTPRQKQKRGLLNSFKYPTPYGLCCFEKLSKRDIVRRQRVCWTQGSRYLIKICQGMMSHRYSKRTWNIKIFLNFP